MILVANANGLNCMAQVVLGGGSLVPKLYILRGGTVQISQASTGKQASMAEAGGFSYFGENVLEVRSPPASPACCDCLQPLSAAQLTQPPPHMCST